MKKLHASAFAFFLFSAISVHSYAQASLAAENIITDVSVREVQPDGSTDTQHYTLVRDAAELDQWYYYPRTPRLAEYTVNGKRMPRFSLIRYSYTKDGVIMTGGLLTFSITLGAQQGALEDMKKAVAEIAPQRRLTVNASKIRIAPLPFKSSTVAVYSPSGDLLGASEANQVGASNRPGAVTASSELVFALPLTAVGTDVYEKLVKSTGGLPVSIHFKFNGLTPPEGFKVTANWDLAYDHYSRDSKFRATASYFGLVTASYGSDETYVRDELIKSGAIKIEARAGENISNERLDAYLQPILKRLNDGLLEEMKPPAKIDPAQASTPGASGFFGGAGYSVAVKDEHYRRRGSETWDFRVSQIVERASVVEGLVTLRGFSDDAREGAFTEVNSDSDAGNWKQVFFSAPRLPRLDRANLRISLKGGGKSIATSYLRYDPVDGWINEKTQRRTSGEWFSLLGYKQLSDTNLSWDASYEFVVDQYTVNAASNTPLSPTNPVLYPADIIRIYTVSPAGLPFDVTQPGGKILKSVAVRLSCDGRDATRLFTGANTKAVDELRFPVTKANEAGHANKPKLEVSFNFASGPVRKTLSAEELDAQFLSGAIELWQLLPTD